MGVIMEPMLFRDILKDAEFQRCCHYEIRHFVEGDTIIEEGSPGSELYLIIEGTADVLAAVDHLSEPGRTTGIAKLFPGDIVGELGLFAELPRTATVVATRPAAVAVMDGRDLMAYMDHNPVHGYWILKEILFQVTRRLRETSIRCNTITALYFNDFSN